MNDPQTLLHLHRLHAADLRDRAETARTARESRSPHRLRTALGWHLVEVGLRLASPTGGMAAAR